LLSVLVVGGDIAWHAHNAYSQIFVPPPPQPVLTANAAGTPELVLNPTHSAGTPQNTLNPTPAAPAPTPFPDWTGSGRVNVLLLGADTNQARQATGEPALSDTIIIVSIDPVTKQVGIMSLPRDMQVTIPGVGLGKINAAYSIGSTSSLTGPGLVQATIEYNFHIHIDYFAVVDFAGFQKIINTMGGVTVDVPAPLKDNAYPGEQFNYTRIVFHTGLQHMDGLQALRYVRTRHDDNDFARGIRQQQVLETLRQQATTGQLLPHAPTLIDELGSTVRTDIPLTNLLKLAKLGTEINQTNIHSYNLLPALTEQWNPSDPNSIYYLIPDWSKVQQIVNQMIPPPPAATPTAQAPAWSARILVENGTHINLLAASSANILVTKGFANVDTAQAANAGQYAQSQILWSGSDQSTALFVAQTLGLPASEVTKGDSSQTNGYAVVVILGNDAPVPGG
ncbi:MAG TPA: LCP family protein, partial [Nitrolancea sp.]|nr:LCP family protein [Nitrolancea sp.]